MAQENKDILQKSGLLGIAMIGMSQGSVMLYNEDTAWVGLVLYGLSILAMFLREVLKTKK